MCPPSQRSRCLRHAPCSALACRERFEAQGRGGGVEGGQGGPGQGAREEYFRGKLEAMKRAIDRLLREGVH